MDTKRLIEETFPLKQASLDSVHEKNVRHGHISTLHIWPARRPLAACRAALIAALLPDPGNAKKRLELLTRIGGELIEREGRTETEGGILHWGREQNKEVAVFRKQIRAEFGGRAPKVLDMFAGGGAIPLEAMRLGCEVTAIDYNPVAYFILKCTLEYPNRFAEKRFKLPGDASGLQISSEDDDDLATHVRYWGNWVLVRASEQLNDYYPTLPLVPDMPVSEDNPLCSTVAYLWARTVPHPDPAKKGLQVPLLKTLWLCKTKKGKKRALRIKYNANANRYEFEVFTPTNENEVGTGTMTRTGVLCPPTADGESGVFMRSDYIQHCGQEGLMAEVCTAVVVGIPPKRHSSKQPPRKEYRSPTEAELIGARRAADALSELDTELPLGLPNEPIDSTRPSPNTRGASGLTRYGLNTWAKIFTPRQMLAVGTFAKFTRQAKRAMHDTYRELPALEKDTFIEAITAYLAVTVDRLADRNSTICHFDIGREGIVNTFQRYALPINWDFAEINPASELSGGYPGALEWVWKVVKHTCNAATSENVRVLNGGAVHVLQGSAVDPLGDNLYDCIVTDPPYYDAIPYSDLSDFFYVWLRRTIGDTYPEAFSTELTPKSGELIQHANRHANVSVARKIYEDGMAAAFRAACMALRPDGCMVIVFAHKNPDAWETLVGAMIRAGFVVTASWPIDTEMTNKAAGIGQARLSSSVWLVCRKRPTDAGKGWYKVVQPRMKERITERLRYFWDMNVRGPDFLWAAVGPGLEAFSAYDEVRKMDGTPFSVSEFIKEIRRLTTDFALGQILHGGTEGLDELTRYALMHYQNFSVGGAPVGECILLAGAYGLDLNILTGPRGILTKGKGLASKRSNGDEDQEDNTEIDAGVAGGSELRLLNWEERKRDDLGEPHASGSLSYIDVMHRMMREWASGDITNVAFYADGQGLGQNELFWRVTQAFIEMSPLNSRERALLEALISWGRGRVATAMPPPPPQKSKPATLTLDL